MNRLVKQYNVLVPPRRVHTFLKDRHPKITCGPETCAMLAVGLDEVLRTFILEVGRHTAANQRVAIRPDEVSAVLDDQYSPVARVAASSSSRRTVVSNVTAPQFGSDILYNPNLHSQAKRKKIIDYMKEQDRVRESIIGRLAAGESIDSIDRDEMDGLLPVEGNKELLAVLPPTAAAADETAGDEAEEEEEEEEQAPSSDDEPTSVAERTRSRKSKKKRRRRSASGDADGRKQNKRRRHRD